MRKVITTILVMLLSALGFAQDYQIDWYVIGSGGGHAESNGYSIDATIGQPIVGQSSSDNYAIDAGFWVGVGGPADYQYLPGDANMYNGQWPPAAIGGDVTYLVNYFRGSLAAVPCLLSGFWASADANGDCSIIGSDVTRMVNYFRSHGTIQHCPDYPPLYPPIPPSAPPGWPNCETSTIMMESKVIPIEPAGR